jgi:hypothetical protein
MPSAARLKPARKSRSGPPAAEPEATTNDPAAPAATPAADTMVATSPTATPAPATASAEMPTGPGRWSGGLAGRRIFASGLALALGLGAAGGFMLGERRQAQATAAAMTTAIESRAALAALEARAKDASEAETAVSGLAEEIRGMRAELETLRAVLPRLAAAEDLRALDRRVTAATEAAESGPAQQAVALAGVIDLIDQAATQAAGGLTDLGARMGRLDGALAAKTAPAEPSSTASIVRSTPRADGRQPDHPTEPPKTEAPRTVPGWTVRGVFNGVALLEGPHGVYEAMRGDALPGLGRVEAIHRQGRSWSVVTSRGIVGQPHR